MRLLRDVWRFFTDSVDLTLLVGLVHRRPSGPRRARAPMPTRHQRPGSADQTTAEPLLCSASRLAPQRLPWGISAATGGPIAANGVGLAQVGAETGPDVEILNGRAYAPRNRQVVDRVHLDARPIPDGSRASMSGNQSAIGTTPQGAQDFRLVLPCGPADLQCPRQLTCESDFTT